MQALKPWGGMTSVRREMDRLFERVLQPVWPEMAPLGDWEPRLDIAESKDAVIVKAELPGVEQKDVSVTLDGGVLTIKGEREHEKEEKDKRYHRVERTYGAFCRSMRLPAGVDASKTTASFKDGLLTITLPKAAGANGTAIPIKGA
jgi:HSP20 family protein